ncbi:hypothetical protein AAG570_006352 [Ranatra chinensis]|uniref:BTB domain-containing protein n=1 Tax=Ranatra chinensis TaxID=642074 RepID=A0ABD0YTR2_9HEMI
MGKVFSAAAYYCPDVVTRSISNRFIQRGSKRKKESISEDEAELIKSLHSPKRKKLICTAHYIYKALFVEGKDSDVTVNMLNKDWKLHKVYLRQSHYFNSMFSGSWNETNKSYIPIEVADPNIATESLNVVFGSFYLDEISIEPCVVVGVLAAATLFQMEGLIEQCCEIMAENVCPLTAVQFYNAACRYGLQNVKALILEWFAINLLEYYYKNVSRLHEIDTELMTDIVSHPKLCVIQTEMFLYLLLRKWVFIQCNPNWDEMEDSPKDCEQFFRSSEDNTPFLLTERGMEYMNVFRHIRLGHLLLHIRDVSIITLDKIIPETWLLSVYASQWVAMLRISSGIDKGPVDINEQHFKNESMRFGRVIESNENHSWRWNGFTYGVDLVWSVIDHSLIVKRQRNTTEYTTHISTRNIITRLEVITLNEKRQVKKRATTGVRSLSLSRNQEVKLLDLDKDFEYPLYITVNLLLTSPVPDLAAGSRELNT